MEENQPTHNHRKLLFLIPGIILLIAITALIIFFLNRSITPQATAIILVTPREATININGTEYHNGTHQIKPADNASITIESPGFETKTMTANIDPNSPLIIEDYLLNTETGFNYYKSNLDDYKILKLLARDENALKFIEQAEAILSIQDYLPMNGNVKSNNLFYSITIENHDSGDCENLVCLDVYINSDADKENLVKQFLQENNFNINDYQIFYQDFSPYYSSGE